uniref:Uncharacterized protein n=1 Tax=Arundo donax TaxID=35708 RepID=A0A0A9BV65_ARUDO
MLCFLSQNSKMLDIFLVCYMKGTICMTATILWYILV